MDFAAVREDEGATLGARAPPPKVNWAAALGAVGSRRSSADLAMSAAASERCAKLEEARGAAAEQLADLQQQIKILEDRMREVDNEARASAGKTHHRLDQLAAKDKAAVSKTWNLANQVDVIQSVVNMEMSHVRRAMEHMVDRKLLSHDQNATKSGK